MAYDLNGTTIETNEKGYLEQINDWSEELAEIIAKEENINLTDKHWDLIKFLREEYINNNQNQPNTRAIVKAMSEAWGAKIKQKDVYDLFPGDPSKQGGKIGGLPESRRKGGY